MSNAHIKLLPETIKKPRCGEKQSHNHSNASQ